MSLFTRFLALFVVFVCSMGTMANPAAAKMIIIETLADLEQQPAELQIQSFIEAPANQEVAPTDTTAMEDSDSDSESSESSEESPTATDMDTDADTDADTADAGNAASISNGALPIPNVNLVNDADAVSGNLLPMKGKNLPSNQDVSTTSAAGIAIAAMAMVAFVVGSIVFVIKKYRHNFPVVVRV